MTENKARIAETRFVFTEWAKSTRLDPMVNHSFEVGGPVLARDYRNRRTAWTKGVIQDRLGPVK